MSGVAYVNNGLASIGTVENALYIIDVLNSGVSANRVPLETVLLIGRCTFAMLCSDGRTHLNCLCQDLQCLVPFGARQLSSKDVHSWSNGI